MNDNAPVTERTLNELLLDGRIAPPTANGEVVFEAPWQGRVFGMARLLAEARPLQLG